MIREQKVLSGPGPADFSPTQAQENNDPASPTRSRMNSTQEPTLRASSQHNHSLFAFGGYSVPDDPFRNPNGSIDFLPAVNFDDLHTSLLSSDDLKLTEFPAPGGQGNIFRGQEESEGNIMTSREGGGGAAPRGSSAPRAQRSGSILRRGSLSTRKNSLSSTASGASSTTDASTTQLAVRTRRTSQYPPITGLSNTPKGPRKSIGGSGIAEGQLTRNTSQRRRPSLTASPSISNISERSDSSALNNALGGLGDRVLSTPRSTKAKSLLPPSKQSNFSSLTPTLTPEHGRSSSFTERSSHRLTLNPSTPTSSAKRMSVMPGMPPSASHATGLGARTISPTDTRRARRLSTFPAGIPVPVAAPSTPVAEPVSAGFAAGRLSKSPSMLPRKTPTPSSNRTTPDPNRKSYSSGLSVASNQSANTARTSTGSLQPRPPQAPSTSRLPTPKSRNLHSSAGNNEEEEVPPVPAIPKAYESPKESPADAPFFARRKTSMPFDTSSVTSNSANENGTSTRDPTKTDRRPIAKRNPTESGSDVDRRPREPREPQTPATKKSLQPLRLPPLNLLPLSTPTSAKIAALHDNSDGNMTPPPHHGNARTPTTPMTASRTTFFSRSNFDDRPPPFAQHGRANSTTRQLRSEASNQTLNASNATSVAIPIVGGKRSARQSVSPYLSSSLPKQPSEYNAMPRSKTQGDIAAAGGSEQRSRLTGPRAPKLTRPSKAEETPTESSPEEPITPSSGTSLRRKLSLSWKRNNSKSNINLSHAAAERDSEYPPQPPKHDNMPPPRLPASVAVNSSSPSPSVKSSHYLDSKRRKSSISSINGHDRKRSDNWSIGKDSKKESTNDNSSDRSIPVSVKSNSSALNPMHKMLATKPSMAAVRPQDRWTAELDRDDMIAEEEMKKLASKRKETEIAARQLDALRKRACAKDRVSPHQAVQNSSLNIYERGEIVDYKDVYFCGTPTAPKHVGNISSEAANFGYDDERGDYQIVPGDHLSYRYEIIDILGKGSFGQVVRCIDHKTGLLVAIKIIRNKKRFHQQALVEVNILQKLREWDPKNRHSMINFTQSFYFRGHLCISTELLNMNLYEFIKFNGFRGFSLKLIRRFNKQLLSSLLLLKQHKVIHCDLKPENVLLAHPIHSEIKVIDFGSSCFENEKVYTYIQSRFYRSPEVILGMTYGMPIDMWSLGCILAELYTGYPIFPGENEQEQLACIMEVFGPPEKHLIEKSTRKKLFFDSLGKPRLTVSSKGRRRRPSSKTLSQVLKCDDEAFLDFLTRCLRWDPDRRMKPEEAVRHEFMTGQKMPPRTSSAPRTDSPIKRFQSTASTSGSTSTSNRPLPDPPGFKSASTIRTRNPSGSSPSKALPLPSSARRQSIVNGGINATGKRVTSNVNPPVAGSGLPRVTRSVSARHDLASAGATAAMTRRA